MMADAMMADALTADAMMADGRWTIDDATGSSRHCLLAGASAVRAELFNTAVEKFVEN